MAVQLLNPSFLGIQPSKPVLINRINTTGIITNNNKRKLKLVTSCASTTTYDFDDKKRRLQKMAAKRGLRLYNILRKDLLEPQGDEHVGMYDEHVGMYLCGVTPNDLADIDHARVYVTFDILFRYLCFMGYEAIDVRNFTNVDDKIIARAGQLGEDPISLSRRFGEEFQRDMRYLNCIPITVEPRVSDHMPEIIDMIKQMLDDGYAYRVEGDVYYSVDKFPLYRRLSACYRAGERVAVDWRKRNPADFALWESAKEGETFWESPWGPGRPGWYIECSVMSAAYLGCTHYPHGENRFEIHGIGGKMDLIFPHHENESNISYYWKMGGCLTIDFQKMSTSLCYFFTVRQVLELFHPLALRLFIIGYHYPSNMNYSNVKLEYASDHAYYIYQTLQDCEEAVGQQNEPSLNYNIPTEIYDEIEHFNENFIDCMSSDLQSQMVLAVMSHPLKAANDLLHTHKVANIHGKLLDRLTPFFSGGISKLDPLEPLIIQKTDRPELFLFRKAGDSSPGKNQGMRIQSLAALEKTIRNVLDILGLMPASYHEVLHELRGKALKRAKLTEDQVIEKINEWNSARKNKEYERSDLIRKDLAARGIALIDSPEGTSWRPALPLAMQGLYALDYHK